MRFKVKVEQGDIDRGEPGKKRTCPIARATNRTLAEIGAVNTMVHTQDITIFVGMTPYRRGLPNKARYFIDTFDRHGPVQPFEFTITLPKSAIVGPPAWAG